MENEEQKYLILDIMSITMGINFREWEAKNASKLTIDLGPRDRLEVFGKQILPGLVPGFDSHVNEEQIQLIIKMIFKLENDFMNSLKDPSKLREIAKELIELIGKFKVLDPQLTKSVLGLIDGKLENCKGIIKALVPDGTMSDEKIDNIFKYIEEAQDLINKTLSKLESMGVSTGKKDDEDDSKKKRKIDDEGWGKILAKIKEGTASSNDLFKVVDEAGDGNGSVNESEFHQLAKRLGLSLSKHRVKEIFAKVKGKKALKGSSMELNEREFEKALKYLQ